MGTIPANFPWELLQNLYQGCSIELGAESGARASMVSSKVLTGQDTVSVVRASLIHTINPIFFFKIVKDVNQTFHTGEYVFRGEKFEKYYPFIENVLEGSSSQ